MASCASARCYFFKALAEGLVELARSVQQAEQTVSRGSREINSAGRWLWIGCLFHLGAMQETQNFDVLICFPDLKDDQVISMHKASASRPPFDDMAAVRKLCQAYCLVH
jgi:hypothetical protein